MLGEDLPAGRVGDIQGSTPPFFFESASLAPSVDGQTPRSDVSVFANADADAGPCSTPPHLSKRSGNCKSNPQMFRFLLCELGIPLRFNGVE